MTTTPRELLATLRAGTATALPYSAAEVATAQAVIRGEAQDITELPEPLALAVLESLVQRGDVSGVERLAGASSAVLAKAAKKARYQLKSRGLHLPEPTKAVVLESALAEEPPGLLGAITGNGERALLVARPAARGLELIQAVLSDELGVTRLEVDAASRGAYRKHLEALSREPYAPIQISFAEAKSRLARAAALNELSRRPFPEGLADALRHLGLTPRREEDAIGEPTPEDEALAADAAALHDEPELAAWMPPEAELRALANTADASLEAVLRAAAPAFLSPAMRSLYGRRLFEMGEYFSRSGRAGPGAVAGAEGRRLWHHAPGPSRFIEALFAKVLRLTRGVDGATPEQERALTEGNPPDGGMKMGEGEGG